MDGKLVDHECAAIHCPACCPVQESYTRGWEDGKSWNAGMTKLAMIEDTHIETFIILLLMAVVVIFIVKDLKRRREARHHEDNA